MQRQKDLLEGLKNEPALRKAYLQKIVNEDQNSDDSDEASLTDSIMRPKTCDPQDSNDLYGI